MFLSLGYFTSVANIDLFNFMHRYSAVFPRKDMCVPISQKLSDAVVSLLLK